MNYAQTTNCKFYIQRPTTTTTQHLTGTFSVTTIELEREIREAERQLWLLERKAAKRDRWSMNSEKRVMKT